MIDNAQYQRPASLRHFSHLGQAQALRYFMAVRTPAGRKTMHRIYSISVASVYPHYVTKAEKKGRTKGEVDEIISWLTGYDAVELTQELEKKTNFEDFFARAPRPNPARALIKGVICGVRVEED
jgi:hypothetical protein